MPVTSLLVIESFWNRFLIINYYLPQASLKWYSYYLSRLLSSLSLFQSRAWTLSLGFSLAYGAMFSKTWRVHLIFTNKKLKRKVELEIIRKLLRCTVEEQAPYSVRTKPYVVDHEGLVNYPVCIIRSKTTGSTDVFNMQFGVLLLD